MFAIQDIPNKGKGLVATCDIDKGTRILNEEPLLDLRRADKAVDIRCTSTFPYVVIHRVKALLFDKQQEFLELYDPDGNLGYTRYLSIVRANGLKLQSPFPADHHFAGKDANKKAIEKAIQHAIDNFSGRTSEKPDVQAVGVFAIASRINHDCQANAHKAWNEITKRYTLHAIRKISEGEEITINYHGIHSMPGTLKDDLNKKLGFDCACRLCSLPVPEPNAYEENASKVRSRTEATLTDFNGTCVFFGVPPVNLPGYGDCMRYMFVADMYKLLENIDCNARIYKKHGMVAAVATSLSWAGKVCCLYGDLARASVFWQWAAHKWRKLEGDDSPKFIYCKEQGKNPQRPRNTKGLRKWWSEVDDVPEGLEYEDDKRVFESWLWARPQGYLGPDMWVGLKAPVISKK